MERLIGHGCRPVKAPQYRIRRAGNVLGAEGAVLSFGCHGVDYCFREPYGVLQGGGAVLNRFVDADEQFVAHKRLQAAAGILYDPRFFVIGLLAGTEYSAAYQAGAPPPDTIAAPLVPGVGDLRFAAAIHTYHVNMLSCRNNICKWITVPDMWETLRQWQ